MWRSRIAELAARRPEFLRLNDDPGDPAAFHGRYLTVSGHPFAAGQFIAHGAEALVYELVDLRTGLCSGVVKICRFRAGTPRYERWAVPRRAELNPYSLVPGVETVPARLVPVPGGLVKCQVYVTNDPATDWRMDYPAYPVYDELEAGRPDMALRLADALIERHGPRAILLETRGRVLERLGRVEDAIAVLQAAVEAHVRAGNAGRLSASLLLARVHWNEYWTNPGEFTQRIVHKDSGLTMTFFATPEETAADDERQDRGPFVLLEALAEEPYFVGGLVMLTRMVVDEVVGREPSGALIAMIQAVDPACPDLPDLTARFAQRFPRRPAPDPPPSTGDHPPGGAHVDVPAEVAALSARFEARYQPEPVRGQQPRARWAAAAGRLREGRSDLAERDLRAAIALDPDVLDYRVQLMSVLMNAQRLAEAAHAAEEAVALFPDDYAAYVALGNVHTELGRLQDAKISYLRALALDPADPGLARVRLGQTYRELGERDQALAFYRAAHAAEPTDEDVVLFLVQALRAPSLRQADPASDPQFAEAYGVLRDGLRHNPDSAPLLVCEAQSLLALGRYDDALRSLRRAVDVDPKHPAAAEFLRELQDFVDSPAGRPDRRS
jgi:tetratricopeptide (TPR) repeat protein